MQIVSAQIRSNGKSTIRTDHKAMSVGFLLPCGIHTAALVLKETHHRGKPCSGGFEGHDASREIIGYQHGSPVCGEFDKTGGSPLSAAAADRLQMQ